VARLLLWDLMGVFEVLPLQSLAKSDVINNVFYYTTAEIRKNVTTFIDNIMQEPLRIIDRLCIRM
jgi:hypothetical protein